MIKKEGRSFIPLIILLTGFFYFQNLSINNSLYLKTAKADEQTIVINEIAWMGTVVSANDEWLELKNLSGQTIDLSGWTLKAIDGSPEIELAGAIEAQSFFLLERTDDSTVPEISADLIYSGALGNLGEVLELRDNQNNLIDIIDANVGWPAGNNENKKTMERIDNGWQTSDNVGGTPKAQNSNPSEQNDQDENNQETGENDSGQTTVNNIKYKIGDVLINEFVSDPADNESEWVELYNTLNENISLSGWSIEEGSGAKTILDGSIDPKKYFLIMSPKGNLNNGGDLIILKDNSGNLIDKVAYGAWDDGNLDDNAPLANDPLSTARREKSLNTFNNANDFTITSAPSPGTTNLIKGVEIEGLKEYQGNGQSCQNLQITELFPNPTGSDNEGEFIELYNSGNSAIDLLGWGIKDQSRRKFIFKESLLIAPGGYLSINRALTKIALNNDGDKADLYAPMADSPCQTLEYDNAIEGWSYAKTDFISNAYEWTETVTPNKENIIKGINHPPLIKIYYPEKILAGIPAKFDSSDTVDADSDSLEFEWDFGDGIKLSIPDPEHTFLKPGEYLVSLAVGDGKNMVKEEKTIHVFSGQETASRTNASGFLNSIVINEIFPNPSGADAEEEWIELKNTGKEKINLQNWIIDDIEGGSPPYKFKKTTWIDDNGLLFFSRPETKIALNNDFDSIRLFNPNGDLIDSVEYFETFQDESFARGLNNKWFWTSKPSPGEENTISFSNNSLPKISLSSSIPTINFTKINSSETNFLENGSQAKISGIVAVLPGALGSQYFYIIGSPGIQVYSYKKDFPEIKIGDLVEVSGEISESLGEKRIKTKTKDDIIIISGDEELIPLDLSCEEALGENSPSLIKVAGVITDAKGSTIYLDDGANELPVYLKSATGLKAKNYPEGEEAEITGLLIKSNSGVRLLPRGETDIKLTGAKPEEGQVLGEFSAEEEWGLEPRDKKQELFKYLLIIATGIIFLLGGLLVKQYLNRKTNI